jgi:hypothetical protein
MAKRVVRPPPKGQKTKNKKRGFGLFGVAGPPQGPRVASGFFFFFFFLGLLGVAGQPLGHGGGRTTPKSTVGVAGATPDFLIFLFFSFFLNFFFKFMAK